MKFARKYCSSQQHIHIHFFCYLRSDPSFFYLWRKGDRHRRLLFFLCRRLIHSPLIFASQREGEGGKATNTSSCLQSLDRGGGGTKGEKRRGSTISWNILLQLLIQICIAVLFCVLKPMKLQLNLAACTKAHLYQTAKQSFCVLTARKLMLDLLACSIL